MKPRSVKSRGGCRTCKLRRIKCDEAKPACSRCLKSGRTCDGYGILIKTTSPPAMGFSSASLVTVHSHRSERENRSFDYFRHKATSELMGFNITSDFWSHVVLRFSEASPAVFRAVMSISSLHETTYGESGMKASVEDRMLFLRQYNRAIRELCSRQSVQPVQFTLTCCILFICLENLRGDYDAALLHLEKGLEILKEWDARDEGEAWDTITKAFQRLDMQATTFLDRRQPRCDISEVDGIKQSETKPIAIANLQQARATLEALILKLFYVITTKSNPQQPPWSEQNEYLPVRKSLLHGLNIKFAAWKSAFDVFSIENNRDWKKEELRLSVLLALHHHTTSLMLNIRLNTDTNGIYRGVPTDLDWENINDICDSMIKSISVTIPSFSADIGVIAPLYFTAMQANNARISQRAIDLLYRIKWKEGFWDAGTAARVAERFLHHQITDAADNADSSAGVAGLAKACGITSS